MNELVQSMDKVVASMLSLLAKFHLHRCNVSPLRGEKPQNRSLTKLNITGALRCAQCCRLIMLSFEDKF